MPDAHPMAFKGGTSLSKIWSAISRFSEDVDITIDYRSFGVKFDHREGKLSNKKQNEINDHLRAAMSKIEWTEQMIPTRVGVNRDPDGRRRTRGYDPHTRGGEPTYKKLPRSGPL